MERDAGRRSCELQCDRGARCIVCRLPGRDLSLDLKVQESSVQARSASPASYLARFHFDDPQVRSVCVGVVYEAHAGDAQQNSIQLGRDGVLRWHRK